MKILTSDAPGADGIFRAASLLYRGGARAVWPLAFLFVLTGYVAAGFPGVAVGLLASAAVGWYVGHA